MKHILTLLFAVNLLWASSQDYKLVYYKGEVTISGQKLATNTPVKNDAVVTIGSNTEAIFTNSNKDVVHLNKAGDYPVRIFASYVKPKSSLSGYYLNYVANAATHHDAEPEKHPTENLKNVGGVSRGRNRFLNFPVIETKTADTVVTFEWLGSENGNYYWMLIEELDSTQELIASNEVSENRFTLFVTENGGIRGHKYKWVIKDMNSGAKGTALLNLVSEEEYKEMEKDFRVAVSSFEDIPQELLPAFMAAFLQDKGYYLLAEKGYLRALELTPDNEFLKELYATFRKNIYGE